MVVFCRARASVLSLCRIVVSGMVIAALLAGFSFSRAMAAGHGGGGHGAAGVQRSFSYSVPMPAAMRYLPGPFAPKSPTHRNYLPQKPAPQSSVAQKHSPQKHAPQKHLAQQYATPKHLAQRRNPGKNSVGTLTLQKHASPMPASLVSQTYPLTSRTNWSPSVNQPVATYSLNREWAGTPYERRWHDLHRPWWHHRWWDDNYGYFGGDGWYSAGYSYDSSAYQQQMAIQSIRAQIEAAEGVLQDAVSQAEIRKSEREAAQQRITEARAAIDRTAAEQLAINQALRAIEAKLLAEQESDSEVARAEARLKEMEVALDREMHRVLSLPEHATTPTAADYAREFSMLLPHQKAKLHQDPLAHRAIENLKAVAEDAVRARKALFEKDPAWSAAKDAALKARREHAQANRDLSEIESAESLAAQARKTIAAGKAALRSL